MTIQGFLKSESHKQCQVSSEGRASNWNGRGPQKSSGNFFANPYVNLWWQYCPLCVITEKLDKSRYILQGGINNEVLIFTVGRKIESYVVKYNVRRLSTKWGWSFKVWYCLRGSETNTRRFNYGFYSSFWRDKNTHLHSNLLTCHGQTLTQWRDLVTVSMNS